MPSVQLSTYFQLRGRGIDVAEAAEQSGLGSKEAQLWEEAVANGEASFSQGEDVMAKKATPGDGVTNLTETKDIIRNAVPRIINLKEQRKEINAEIQAEREKVNAAGVPKKALDHAIRVKEMDPDDRQKFDEGYAIARDALGVGQSRSLFDVLDGEQTVEDNVAALKPQPASAPVPDAVH